MIVDKLDKQIINCLLKDGQMPFSRIANQLDTSTDTVIRRYNSLKETGVIQKASIVLDIKKCGFEETILFLIKLCPNADANKTFEVTSHMTNVIVVSHTMGDYDMLVQAIYSGIEDFNAIIDAVSNISEIEYFDVCVSQRSGVRYFPAYAYYSKAYDPWVAPQKKAGTDIK